MYVLKKDTHAKKKKKNPFKYQRQENSYSNPAFSKHPYSGWGKRSQASHLWNKNSDKARLETGFLQSTRRFCRAGRRRHPKILPAPGRVGSRCWLRESQHRVFPTLQAGNLIPAPKWKNLAWQKSLYYASSSILPLLAHVSVLSRGTIATPQTIYSIKNNLLSFVSSFPASEAQERKICWFFKTSDVRDYL